MRQYVFNDNRTDLLRQVLGEPLDSLLCRLVHSLLVLIATPVTPQSESVNLVLIQLPQTC